MFFGNNAGDHSFFMGTSGKGKSVFSEQARKNARQRGDLLVDTEMFREGRGLKPYEHEYARRLVLGLSGPLPRELRGKPVTVISDVSRPKKVKRQPKHIVKTVNGVILERQLVADAREQLEMQTGVRLKQPQLIELMEESGIDETLAEFGEAETQIREMLADALAMKLVGRSWPTCGALYNAADKSDVSFAAELDVAAKEAGYTIR
ncbi:phage head-tail adapter protein [Vibrio cholerae]|nr:phage head-tail adapter protein [Vibrio cholerae]ELH5115312.1 phage head-tail adapter protein [Vibrio cholerae]